MTERPHEPIEPGPGARARGATLGELFQNAALGTAALLVDPGTVSPGGLRDRWTVSAPDPEALLEAWLNEVVFQFARNNVVLARVTVRRLKADPGAPCSVEAEIDGELQDPGRHDARHALGKVARVSLARDGEEWRSEFIFKI